ncbi:MAG TPA: hypothetical protein VLA69_03990 [Gaiellaceae bacterium]|nr:hypothetical protein [Gaiellaceae bacterium]
MTNVTLTQADAREPQTHRAVRRTSFALARWTTAAWGALHVLGGALLLTTTLRGGPRETLLDLGSAADLEAIPSEPGSVVEAVLGFHALNIVWFGLAALILAWRGTRTAVRDGLFVMAAADVGLVLFMVGPGQMRPVEGIWGPLLLVIATAAFLWSRRHPERPAPASESYAR